jgi:hypothetical protein
MREGVIMGIVRTQLAKCRHLQTIHHRALNHAIDSPNLGLKRENPKQTVFIHPYSYNYVMMKNLGIFIAIAD